MRPFTLLLVLLALSATPAPSGATAVDTLAFLGHTVAVGPGGDALLTTTLVRVGGEPGEALLPFGYAGADSFAVVAGHARLATDSTGAPAPLRRVARRRLLALALDAGAPGETTVVRCRLRGFVDWTEARGEFGAYALSRTFVNDADVSLGSYRLVVSLPPGYLVRRITATEPAYNAEESPTPPFAVGRAYGRSFASMQGSHLRPGSRVKLALQAEHARRGPVPLLGGLAILLLYLWFFRDDVEARRAAAPASQPSTRSR
jgi:hypothetical protein